MLGGLRGEKAALKFPITAIVAERSSASDRHASSSFAFQQNGVSIDRSQNKEAGEANAGLVSVTLKFLDRIRGPKSKKDVYQRARQRRKDYHFEEHQWRRCSFR